MCTWCVLVHSVCVKEHRANPGGPQEQRENEKLLESQQGFLLSLEEDSSSPAHARPGNEGGMKVGMMEGKGARRAADEESSTFSLFLYL